MRRCLYCHALIAKHEDHCYICGDQVPKLNKTIAKQRPVSVWTNVIFIASLAFTAYCFFGQHTLSLPVTLAISSTLLLLRILAEQFSDRGSS